MKTITTNPLRRDLRGGRISDHQHRQLIRMVDGVRGDDTGVRVRAGRNEIVLSVTGVAGYGPGSFSLTQAGGRNESVQITEGRFVVHGIGLYSVATTNLTLTGGPYVWVYAWATPGSWATNGIALSAGTVAADEPRTTNSTVVVTLYEFLYDAGTEFYVLTNRRAGGQDVHFMAAIR